MTERVAASEELQRVLHPRRFPGMSGKFIAILGYVYGVAYTKPEIVGICTTSDGYVLAMQKGDIGYNDFIGSINDCDQNFGRMLDAAAAVGSDPLTPAIREEAEQLWKQAFHTAEETD